MDSSPLETLRPTRPSRRRQRFAALAAGLGILLPTLTAQARLTAEDRQWLEGLEAHQRQGEALAFCDFDGDGFDELAVGLPEAEVDAGDGPLSNAGLVRIYSGDPSGVTPEGPGVQILRLGLLFAGQDAAGNRFGSALAAADFNLDGACDLAIGIPGAEVEGLTAAGRVAVIHGQLGEGLTPALTGYLDQDLLTGSPAVGNRFGSVLAAGPVGDDPFPDLAVGVPEDTVSGFADAGAVHLINARNDGGLSIAFDARLHQDVTDVFGVASPGDRFGASLAIGDVTGDGLGDLVIGSPGDRVGLVDDAGAVQVIPGGPSGVVISIEDQQLLHQDVDDVLGDAAEGDAFGGAVTLGDFDGDSRLDLAVGIPGESQFGPDESGAVQVFFATGDGLSVASEQVLFESLISPEVASFDRFGTALASGDFDGDGHDDLVVGFPLDNVFGVVNAGNVAVLYGGAAGLETTGAQLWNGFTLLSVEPGDEFGFALAVGRLAGQGRASFLAIGAPGREGEGMEPQMGGAMLLRSDGPLFADGFESGDTSNWSSSTGG